MCPLFSLLLVAAGICLVNDPQLPRLQKAQIELTKERKRQEDIDRVRREEAEADAKKQAPRPATVVEKNAAIVKVTLWQVQIRFGGVATAHSASQSCAGVQRTGRTLGARLAFRMECSGIVPRRRHLTPLPNLPVQNLSGASSTEVSSTPTGRN